MAAVAGLESPSAQASVLTQSSGQLPLEEELRTLLPQILHRYKAVSGCHYGGQECFVKAPLLRSKYLGTGYMRLDQEN